MDSVENYLANMAAKAQKADEEAPRDQKPPDLRFKSASPNGVVSLEFTQKMTFPSDILS